MTDLTESIRRAGRPEAGPEANPEAGPEEGTASAPVDDSIQPENEPWPSRWLLLAMGLVIGPATVTVGLLTLDAHTQTLLVWPPAASIFLTLGVWWRGGAAPRGRGFWVVAAVLAATYSLWLGWVHGLGLSGVWVAVAMVSLTIVGMFLYRSALPRDSWAPHTPSDLISLFATCVAVSVLLGAVGAYPGLDLGQLELEPAVQWASRNLANLWTGLATVSLFFYWRRPRVLPVPQTWQLILLGVLGVLCTYLPRAYSDLPLAWMALAPALLAGMTLTPLGGAVYVLLFGTFATAASAVLLPGMAEAGALSNASIADYLLIFSTFVTMLLVLFRDEHARLAQAMRTERAQAADVSDLLEAVFGSMSDGVLLTDPIEGGIVMHNPAARRMLGTAIPTQSPPSWAAYFGIRTPDGSRPVAEYELPLWFEKGTDSLPPKEYGIRNSEGEQRVVAASAHLLRSQVGPRVLLLFHDVTAEQARDRELRGFAGTVAHDLKSPLTALTGWIELAQQQLASADEAAGRHAMTKARQASDQMRLLIDDYLAFTVAREGLLRLGDVPLAELVREVADSYPRDSLAPTFDLDVTHTSRADIALTRQLLSNLVGNAVKYTRPGQRPRIELRSHDDVEPGWVQVVVADRGVGIQPGDEQRIFDAFSRSDKDAEQVAGTGLGLALCHSIVTRHGGRIHAESNEHGGATFRFTLPKA
ncbi:signal transduction histidine kinase [Kineosphaera limosa]|nr:ATP-binding protein [Kineosphaera limosa]NYE00445.1 signal transduction histidine kinase [Kineosphaera limosa]